MKQELLVNLTTIRQLAIEFVLWMEKNNETLDKNTRRSDRLIKLKV
jgi:hypothetical protein